MVFWSASNALRSALTSPLVRDEEVTMPQSVKHASRSVILARARRAEARRRKAED